MILTLNHTLIIPGGWDGGSRNYYDGSLTLHHQKPPPLRRAIGNHSRHKTMVGTKTNLLSVPTLASPHSPTTRVTPPASHGHHGFPEKTSSPHTFALEIGTRDANQIFIRRRRTLRRFHGSTRRASIVAMGQRRYRVELESPTTEFHFRCIFRPFSHQVTY